MKTRLLRSALVVAAAAAAGSIGGSAFAQPASASSDYGMHVAECAQTMRFDGARNPGMHRGVVGWDGTECEHG